MTQEISTDIQYVTIDDSLAYKWTGREPLKIGDKVRLPGNWTTGFKDWVGEVTALESNWSGYHVEVLGRCESNSHWAYPPPLQGHTHEFKITEQEPINGATTLIRFELPCGCGISDLGDFAVAVKAQRGWDVRTSAGWSSSYDVSGRREYSCFVATRSFRG